MLTADEVVLLQAVFRSRALDVAYLSTALRRPQREVRAAIEHLRDRGLLSTNAAGDILDPPQDSVVKVAVDALAAQARTATELGRTLAELPSLIRDWEWGRPGEASSIPAEVIEGPTAIIDAWWRYVDRSQPISTVCIAPDAHAFLRVPPEDAARLSAFVGPDTGGIRIIIDPNTLDQESRPVVDALRVIGLHFRVLANPPSWFIADGDRVAALPARWGDPWPQRVLLVRNPVIADLLRGYYELLWRYAVEIEVHGQPWAPIMRLLDEGLTDEEIAKRLNVSARTVRRRVTEAMQAFDVTNRFTLGRAWSRSLQ
ncbi:MAG TPA: helix-turn-helix transcriptional regulator [Acidimicrobiales bacterium]|nr:helix-turn-helix transcriptional regulator [Acidimicrobiales bacterium]